MGNALAGRGFALQNCTMILLGELHASDCKAECPRNFQAVIANSKHLYLGMQTSNHLTNELCVSARRSASSMSTIVLHSRICLLHSIVRPNTATSTFERQARGRLLLEAEKCIPRHFQASRLIGLLAAMWAQHEA